MSYNGKELMRTPCDMEELRRRPCLYGLPLLLPANRLADGTFWFGEKEYHLPINEPAFHNHIHGRLKDAPFYVKSQDPTRIVTYLENKGEYYPFPFTIEIEDSLSDSGFMRILRLKNTGESPMPYTLAFHCAFAQPASFRVPIAQRCEMDERYLPTGRLLPLDPRQKQYKTGMIPDGNKISGVYTSSDHTVCIGDFIMKVSENFDHWVLFNGTGNEGYLCIEPQCGAVNGLRSEQHCVIEPGEQEIFTISFSLNNLE
jgi:aldose 1-epimerase